MASLTFYANPMSRARIVRWMLEEVGEPYETVVLDYGTTMKGADYLAINPMGKVPAVRHGDAVVTECGAICAYLADAFPEKGLAPPLGDPRRAPYFRWLFFVAGPFEQAATGKSLGLLAAPEQSRMVGYGSYEDTIAALQTAVAGAPYICGNTFTAADVYVGSSIGWGLQFGTVPKSPIFEDYFARVSERPAYKRGNALDDALMPAPAEQPA